jgi:murein DD-endopeptidase MepM/ murein hydrolase activator NlpD
MNFKRLTPITILVAVALSIVDVFSPVNAASNKEQVTNQAAQRSAAQGSSWMQAFPARHVPFMHRPYYGKRTILQRTVSYVDHDKPWYVNDGVFVRFDGTRWTHAGIRSCRAGVNCYDGHNGYDLNLWFEPVLSTAAGTVIRAGWYNPLNHEGGLGLWTMIDHHNGYGTAYGHLSALIVHVGDHVGVQWQIGTSGTSGSSRGPHLHMTTYYLPSWSATDPFGWTGHYRDPNVVPDHYLWVNHPAAKANVPNLSAHGSAIYPGATLVDDGGKGWSSKGNWHRSRSSSDIRGDLRWTWTSAGSSTASATWQATLPTDGYYEVGAFVDDNHASSGWATYTIYNSLYPAHNTKKKHIVYVDQEHVGSFQGPYGWVNTGPQWISLGTYYFQRSTPARVVLSNATGERGLQLAADGVEFAPVSV